MKYIKTYEDQNFLHLDAGDYILINPTLPQYYPLRKAKIIERVIHNGEVRPGSGGERFTRYLIEFPDGLRTYWDNDQILRKLTLEEIEEYELSVNIAKYNL